MAKAPKRNARLRPISSITRAPVKDDAGTAQWHALTPQRSVTKNPHATGPVLKGTRTLDR